jgi:general secretion pathway protein M
MDALKAWWQQASSRDQLSLLVLGVCFFLFVLVQFVLFPVIDMKDKQEVRVNAQKAAYERVKNLAARWKNRNADDGFAAEAAGIERRIEASFSQHGLRVSGFDASGRSGIRVRFDAVNYENLVGWLYDIEITQSIRLKDVSVAGSSDPGLVSASVLIQKN